MTAPRYPIGENKGMNTEVNFFLRVPLLKLDKFCQIRRTQGEYYEVWELYEWLLDEEEIVMEFRDTDENHGFFWWTLEVSKIIFL